MLAEIISIGDELTSGQRLDTNSRWLSQRLGELGIRVLYHTTVADDLEANIEVFQQAASRVDIVVATGGLGPTADDLTREAMAGASGCDLVLDPEQLEVIRALFARRGREMPQRNEVQALFPTGSTPIPNPEGSAPGIHQKIPRHGHAPCEVFALPGVPAEMVEMWEATVGPKLRSAAGANVILHHRLKCFGVGESHLEAMLPDLIRRGRSPSVGITVSGATITLRITARGPSAGQCREAMQPTIDTIHETLGALVFGEEDDELENAVARLLAERGQTLATAEWGTAGLLATWMGAAAEGVYQGGVTIGAPAALAAVDVSHEQRETQQASDKRTASAMAVACRKKFEADYGLAVGPFPDSSNDSPEPVVVALASDQSIRVKTTSFRAHPSILQMLVAKRALNMLRLELLGVEAETL